MTTNVPIRASWRRSTKDSALGLQHILKTHFRTSSLRALGGIAFDVKFGFFPITTNSSNESTTATRGESSRNTPQDFFKETLEFFESDDDVVSIIKGPLIKDEFNNGGKSDENLMVLDEIQTYERQYLKQFYDELDQLDHMVNKENKDAGKDPKSSIPATPSDGKKAIQGRPLLHAKKTLTPLVLLFVLSACVFLATTPLHKSATTDRTVSLSSQMENTNHGYNDTSGINVEEELFHNNLEESSSIVEGTATSSFAYLIETESNSNEKESETYKNNHVVQSGPHALDIDEYDQEVIDMVQEHTEQKRRHPVDSMRKLLVKLKSALKTKRSKGYVPLVEKSSDDWVAYFII
mmetsp:Transcript_6265/g.9632  ORF Transcript_6265/g.9632 Transcript_6265/m.9632 type:complete len:350 (-) Transcript_6265:56-1105(-)